MKMRISLVATCDVEQSTYQTVFDKFAAPNDQAEAIVDAEAGNGWDALSALIVERADQLVLEALDDDGTPLARRIVPVEG